jgi:hypothetical protein
MKMPPTLCVPVCVALLAFAGMPLHVRALPPVVTALDVRGVQTGKVTTLTFSGADLLPNPRLLSTARIRSQKVRDGAKPERVSIDVEVEEDSVPGVENWWFVTDGGVSARSTLTVDAFPQKPFAAQAGTLPVALHGSLSAAQVGEVSFSGTAGQTVQCEVEAQRIQSRLRPVLKLYDSRNVLLAWSPPQSLLRGDCRFQFKLPADGEYRLQVHDLQYAAAAPSYFRLKVGQWTYADAVFPPTVQTGQSAEVRLVGNARENPPLQIPSDAEGEAVPAPRNPAVDASGPRPVVWLSDQPQTVEHREGTSPQALPPLPVSLNGRISKRGEVDVYTLEVQPETEIEVEVVADSIGSPIDAELELRDAKGARLALSDDGTGTPDPKLSYKVPKEVTSLQVAVRDVGGLAGEQCVYRLEAGVKKARSGDFSLKLIEDSQTLRPGAPGVLKVEVLREGGFSGPVDLKLVGLPRDVKITGGRVPETATGALLTFQTDKPFEPTIIALKGTGGGRQKTARLGTSPAARSQPWLDADLAIVGASAPAPEFAAEWGASIEKVALELSGKATLPLRVKRPAGHDGSVRFTLVSSQARLFKQAQLETARMLREEKPVLLAEDKKVQQLSDAVAAAKKPLDAARKDLDAATAKGAATEALGAVVAKAQTAYDQARKALEEASTKAKNEADAVLLVPADLPEIAHGVAFKAELLKRDGRTVEAVAYTPVLEVPVLNPIQVQINPPPPAVLDPKAGAVVELSGRVELRAAAKGEVTVSLTGLPAGVAAPAPAKVKEGQLEFKFSLKFPPSVPAGLVAGVRVAAQGTPFANGAVKTPEKEVPITLQAAPAPAPPAAPPAPGVPAAPAPAVPKPS